MLNQKQVQDEFAQKHEKIGRDLLRNVFSNHDKYRIYFADYENDEVDFIMFGEDKVYAGDVKCYRNPNHIRNHDKFNDYQIDYKKLEEITKKARMLGATPLLVVFFSDQLMIWDLDKIDWQTTKQDVLTNTRGGNYGIKKSIEPQAFLNLKQAFYINKNININN